MKLKKIILAGHQLVIDLAQSGSRVAGKPGAQHSDISFDRVFPQITPRGILHGLHQHAPQSCLIRTPRHSVANRLDTVAGTPDGNIIARALQPYWFGLPKERGGAVAGGQNN